MKSRAGWLLWDAKLDWGCGLSLPRQPGGEVAGRGVRGSGDGEACGEPPNKAMKLTKGGWN